MPTPAEPIAGAPRSDGAELFADRYRMVRVLGEGGMGTVWEAERVNLGERVAIKILRPELAHREDVVGRFLREARAALRIRSEHVARVYDVGTSPTGTPFMVLELLAGEDLGARIATAGKLPVAEAILYVLQACEAIAEAHALGIVHRDIKPSNLFLTARTGGAPLVKVLDFGIAKALDEAPDQPRLTSSATAIGSPMYMSPEQIRDSRSVDARSDVWSLAVTAYELVSGTMPFPAENAHAVLAKVMTEAPIPLDVALPGAPPELWAALSRALAKDPAERPASVAHFARALVPFAPRGARHVERAFDALGLPDAARVPSVRPPSTPADAAPAEPARSRRTPALIALAAVVAVLSAVAVVLVRPAPPPRVTAEPSPSAPPSSPPAAPAPSPEASVAVAPASAPPPAEPPPSATSAKPVPRAPPAKPAPPIGFDARKF